MLSRIATLKPLTAARALRKLFANPDETEHVFEIIDALQGPTLLRTRDRLASTPEGRRLLDTRPTMLPLLCDREGLRQLPEGSLGRAYLDFVDAEGITADGLVEASNRAREDRADELMWIKTWLRDTHDLWHTVLGYQGDLIGEAALLAFSHANTKNIGVGMIAAAAWFKLGRVTAAEVDARATIAEGRRLAKNAAWFIAVPWHEWLARPLEDVRRDLRIVRPVEYQPVRTEEVDVSLVA
ncbi:MAG: Coq4 family protein [Myxococcota bacterium]